MNSNGSTPHNSPLSKAAISILIIEDDEEDYILARDCLCEVGQNYFHIEWSRDFAAGLSALTTCAYDVCLLDYRLGASTGLDILHELSLGQGNTTAILMVAGEDNPDIDKQAMQAGAMGYLVKSEINPVSMERSIRYALSHRLNQLALKDYAMELELKNQELAIARDDALVAIRLKTEFLSNVSHETRTPLNGIIGLIQLLQGTHLTSEQRDAMQAIEDCTETLLVMINNLLDFSRMEGGQLDLQYIDFDIRTTIEEIITRLTPQAHRKNLEVATIIHATVPGMVQGDPGRFRQIMNNLLGNAIKFTETGEIKIHVTVESKDNSKVFVKFCVTDSGIGISEEQQTHLFDIFTQGDGSSTRKYQGAGLGLSVTKHLAELMGGTVRIDSAVGHGSQFWVTIPFTTPLQEKSEATTFTFNPETLRAALICANSAHQASIEYHCQMMGVTLKTSQTTEQGLMVLEEAASHGSEFDVVIIDHSMPGINGFSLTERIKANNTLKSLPILIITEGMRGEAKTAQEIGIAAYLTTPFQHWQFTECLRLITHPSPTDGTSPAPHTKPLLTKHSLRDAHAKEKTRILLVEDNVVNQKVVIRALEKLGNRVDVVASGKDAVTAVHTHSYHLILCDQWQSEFDQASMALLEERLTQASTPMILMTNSHTSDETTILTPPVVATISKPIKLEELASVITTHATSQDKESSPLAALRGTS